MSTPYIDIILSVDSYNTDYKGWNLIHFHCIEKGKLNKKHKHHWKSYVALSLPLEFKINKNQLKFQQQEPSKYSYF